MSKRSYKKLLDTNVAIHGKKVVKEDSIEPEDSAIYDEVDAFHQERDKEILGDLMKDKKKNHVEEEVLGVVASSSSDDEEEYDDDDDDDSDDSVDVRLGKKKKYGEEAMKSKDAWGKSKLPYYGSHADKDYGGWNSDEAEALELEEEDAISRQKKLDAGIEAVDFVGLLASDEEEMEVVSAAKKSNKKSDDKQSKSFNKKGEIDYMLKHSQAFDGLQLEYNQRKAQFDELKPTLDIILSSMKDHPCSFTKQIKAIVAAYTQYLQSYLMFFYLKSTCPIETFKFTENHPVLDDIMKQFPIMKQIDVFIENNYRRLLKVADRLETDPSYADTIASPGPAKKKRRMEETAENEPMEEDIGNIFAKMASGKSKKDNKKVDAYGPALDDTDTVEDKKRKITYEMQKNKGLTVNRKKGAATHSRTKKRNQFKKATKIRRSQVPDVQRETTKYGGERRGIRASLVKSIKLNA